MLLMTKYTENNTSVMDKSLEATVIQLMRDTAVRAVRMIDADPQICHHPATYPPLPRQQTEQDSTQYVKHLVFVERVCMVFIRRCLHRKKTTDY